MSDKTVTARLEARVDGYVASMAKARAETKQVAQELAGLGKTGKSDLKELGLGAAALGGGMLAGLGLAANAAMGFDKELSNLGAVSGATGAEMDLLRQSALDAGQATVYSASEAAKAQSELAKAGISTADILNGALTGSLDLAAAGNLDLAKAAEISANAMTTFGLSGADVPRIADTLAAAANKSAADVSDLALALSQAGLVTAQMGVSLEDTAGTLAAFAQAGLKGSDAGTSLKTMMMRLVPQSQQAADMMKGLNIQFFDGAGNFIGMAGAAEELHSKMAGLTQEQRTAALTTMFGSDAIRGATILYQQGGNGIKDWTGKVTDAGYASDLAAKKLDNLAGDLEGLRGSIETTLIKSSEGATGPLRSLTQATTDFVNGLGMMPPVAQQVTTGFLGITGGMLATGGAIATVLPKYQSMMATLTEMGPAGAKMASGIGMASTALLVAAPGFIAATTLLGNIEKNAAAAQKTFEKGWTIPKSFADEADQFAKRNAEYERLKAVGNRSEGFFHSFGDSELLQNLNPFAEKTIAEAKKGATDYEKVLSDGQEAHNRYGEALTRLRSSLGLTTEEIEKLAAKTGIDLHGEVSKTVPAIEAFKAGLDGGSPAAQKLGGDLQSLTDQTKSAKDRFSEFKSVLADFFGLAFDQGASIDRLQGDINKLPEALKKIYKEGYGAFNGTTDAAIAFRGTMRGVVEDAGKVIESYREQGITGDELKGKVDLLSLSLLQQAIAAGVPKDVALEYLSVLGKIPPSAYTQFGTPGLAQANASLSEAEAAINRIDGRDVSVKISLTTLADGSQSYFDPSGLLKHRARGGSLAPFDMSQVNEDGPELLTSGGKQFLMMGSQGGYVTPHQQTVAALAGARGSTSSTSTAGPAPEVHHHTHEAPQIDLSGSYITDKRQFIKEISDGIVDRQRSMGY